MNKLTEKKETALSKRDVKAPVMSASVGIPRNAALEAKGTDKKPDIKAIERRNKKAVGLSPVRKPKIITVKKDRKEKAPFPFRIMFSALLITALVLCSLITYAEVDRNSTEIAEMKNEIANIKEEIRKVGNELDKKDSLITANKEYIENELGMVKSETLDKEYVSLLPEDKSVVTVRNNEKTGFGVLLSGLGEALRNFFK